MLRSVKSICRRQLNLRRCSDIAAARAAAGLPPLPEMSMASMSKAEEQDKDKEVIAKEHEQDRNWAQDTAKSREFLSRGVKRAIPLSGVRANSMDEWLTKRGFLSSSDEIEEKTIDDLAAHRTITAALSFPLTLSYGINRIFDFENEFGRTPRGVQAQEGEEEGEEEIPQQEQERMAFNHHHHLPPPPPSDKPLRVLVIGARAEASLPALWWREGLAHTSSSAAGRGMDIGMLGPGVGAMDKAGEDSSSTGQGKKKTQLKKLKAKTVQLASFPPVGEDRSMLGEFHKTCEIYTVPNGAELLHEHPQVMQLLLNTDLFVLYNPGLGHSNLRDSWKPTLSLLLSSRKPVLCTAHSLGDYERDMELLNNLSGSLDKHEGEGEGEGGNEEDWEYGGQDLGEPIEMIFAGHENPFRSSRRTYDPKEVEGAKVVTTNQYVYAFQAK